MGLPVRHTYKIIDTIHHHVLLLFIVTFIIVIADSNWCVCVCVCKGEGGDKLDLITKQTNQTGSAVWNQTQANWPSLQNRQIKLGLQYGIKLKQTGPHYKTDKLNWVYSNNMEPN